MAAPDWQLVRPFLVGLVLQTNPLSHQPALVHLVEIVKAPHALSSTSKPFLVLSQIMQTRAFAAGVPANIHSKTRFIFDQVSEELVAMKKRMVTTQVVLSDGCTGMVARN